MTINKAIELLQLNLAAPGSVPIEDLNEAQKLGIEALKTILALRHYPFPDGVMQLPGEILERQKGGSQ